MMLIERLGHRHSAITNTFLQVKAKLEAAMQEQEKADPAKDPGKGDGTGKGK